MKINTKAIILIFLLAIGWALFLSLMLPKDNSIGHPLPNDWLGGV
jgi:hypothetical protein